MIRWLLTTFVALSILSVCWPWLRKLGVGHLPGDLSFRLCGREYFIPLMSTLVLSLLMSAVARFL